MKWIPFSRFASLRESEPRNSRASLERGKSFHALDALGSLLSGLEWNWERSLGGGKLLFGMEGAGEHREEFGRTP